MKNINMEQKVSLLLAAAVAFPLIFLAINVECLRTLDLNEQSIACLSGISNSSVCNIANDEAEFMMDQSEITRRILGNAAPPINYKTLKADNPVSDCAVYGKCIGPESKIAKQRNCGYKEQCRGFGSA